MPEGQEVEMAAWKSPDGIEVQVPADQLKSFEGLNERFNKLTTREQELSQREKEIGDPERLKAKVRDEWLEGMTEDEWMDVAKSMGFSVAKAEKLQDTAADNPQKPKESDSAYAKRIEKLEQELNGFRQQSESEKHQREVQAAEQKIALQMSEISENHQGFKSLMSKRSQEDAFTRAWAELERAGYKGITVMDAMEKAIKDQLDHEAEIIEGHRHSKKAGPGLPGSGGGDIQKPSDPNDPKQRRDFLKGRLRAALQTK